MFASLKLTMQSTAIKFILITIITFGLRESQAQDSAVFISVGENQIIYRNIENKVTVNSNFSSNAYRVVFKYCDSVRELIPNQEYSVIPGNGRIIEIEIIDSKDSNNVFYAKQFKIDYLPDPQLFYGISVNGSKIDLLATKLTAKYTPSFNISDPDTSFEVIRWQISIGNSTFEGNGPEISEEVKDTLAKNKKAQILSVLAVVKGPDGVARKIEGVYEIK